MGSKVSPKIQIVTGQLVAKGRVIDFQGRGDTGHEYILFGVVIQLDDGRVAHLALLGAGRGAEEQIQKASIIFRMVRMGAYDHFGQGLGSRRQQQFDHQRLTAQHDGRLANGIAQVGSRERVRAVGHTR